YGSGRANCNGTTLTSLSGSALSLTLQQADATGGFPKAHICIRTDRTCIRRAASGERRHLYTRYPVVIAPLHRRACRAKCGRCATSPACARFEAPAANERSELVPCASILLSCRINIRLARGY